MGVVLQPLVRVISDVENGRARGVKLAEGTGVEAKQMVITSIEVGQTTNRHLRDVDISPDIRTKVNNLRHDRGGLIWGNIAFHELPDYRAAAWNPDCGKARQVSLLAIESIDKMRNRGFDIGPGDFAENLTTQGIDLVALPVGTRLNTGQGVILEVTQIGKQCHTRCAIYRQIGKCVMPKEGVFARVIRGGVVRSGDELKIG